jgi:TPR repeat protein
MADRDAGCRFGGFLFPGIFLLPRMCLAAGNDDAMDAVVATTQPPRNSKLAADERDSDAQCHYGSSLFDGDGVVASASLAAHYFKLLADHGNAKTEYDYAACLSAGRGGAMDKSLAAHYFKLGYIWIQRCIWLQTTTL